MPVKIVAPRFVRILGCSAPPRGFADDAEETVDKEKETAEKKHGSKDSGYPDRIMLACSIAIRRDPPCEDSDRQERRAEQGGLPAVDGRDALARVIEQHRVALLVRMQPREQRL